MQVAAIAYANFDPDTRMAVDRLIALNPKFPEWTAGLPEDAKAEAAFVRAATWAGDIKTDPTFSRDKVTDPTAGRNIGYADHLSHDYWHFIDIPFSTDETLVRQPEAPNALTQVQLLAPPLGSDAIDDIKSYDLVWLPHLVGDLHQPPQATSRFSKPLDDDRGGNDEIVRRTDGSAVKLHLYWDTLLGNKVTPDEAIAASANLPPPDSADTAVLDPALWIIESFARAQNDGYAPLIGASPFDLTPAYEERALAVARERAALAGARLSGLINASLR